MRALALARNMQSDPRLLLGPRLTKSCVGIAVHPLEIRIAAFVHRNPDRCAGARAPANGMDGFDNLAMMRSAISRAVSASQAARPGTRRRRGAHRHRLRGALQDSLGSAHDDGVAGCVAAHR